jgi:hypothetical protein
MLTSRIRLDRERPELNLWGYTIDTTAEWLLLVVLLALCLGVYISILWFVRKYTTGMLGGFLMLLFGLFLAMGSAFHLITEEVNGAEILVLSFVIAAGCISLIVGAYKLTNFWDF